MDEILTPELVTEALREAVHRAIREHKLLGRSIIVWQDGKVVEIPASEIPDRFLEQPKARVGTANEETLKLDAHDEYESTE